MPQWRDDKILELANQLTFSPGQKRREQLLAAIALAATTDPSKSYPWDFVHFRVTGFQSRAHIDHVLPGEILLADLATLIEFLSDTLSIKVQDAGNWDAANTAGDPTPVLLMDEVSRKFNVSSKTVQRWRKQGLVGLRFIYPDGRRRVGFLESMVARFAADNKDRIDKSTQFTQLSDDERRTIIELARNLAAASAAGVPGAQGAGIKEIARAIAEKMGRAPETVRYTIRKYDREHPESAIFATEEATEEAGETARAAKPPLYHQPTLFEQTIPEAERAEVTQEFDGGLPLNEIADGHGLSTDGVYHVVARQRAEKLKSTSVDFVLNPLFDHPDADNIILTLLPAEALARAQASVAAGRNTKAADVFMARVPRDLPAFLQDIFRLPVMPQEMETDAFRRMNYLKCKAARLIAALNPAAAPVEQLAVIEGLIAQAGDIKNLILQSNLRVAVHVARKHQRPDRPLGELVSDANMWLMRAVEKYDFVRPAKFSTYASYAIMKNFARDRAEQLTRTDSRMVTGQEEVLSGAIGEAEHVGEHVDAAELQDNLEQVFEELPERERDLLMNHYGLDKGRPAKSLSEIGDEMGITKARVRQIEARALRRLRLLMEARQEKLHQATSHPKKTL